MKTNKHTSKKTSRRMFAKSVAATLVAAPLASSIASAQNKNTTRQAVAPPNPSPSPTPQTPSPLVTAYAEVARARFGSAVTPEQFEAIKKDIEGNVRTTERLRSVKLQNGDEPDFVFTP